MFLFISLYSNPTLNRTIQLFLTLRHCLMMYSDSWYSNPTLNLTLQLFLSLRHCLLIRVTVVESLTIISISTRLADREDGNWIQKQYLWMLFLHLHGKFICWSMEVGLNVRVEESMNEWTAQLTVSAEWVEVRSAWMISRTPTTVYLLSDFPTFSTVQQFSCSNSQTVSRYKRPR